MEPEEILLLTWKDTVVDTASEKSEQAEQPQRSPLSPLPPPSRPKKQTPRRRLIKAVSTTEASPPPGEESLQFYEQTPTESISAAPPSPTPKRSLSPLMTRDPAPPSKKKRLTPPKSKRTRISARLAAQPPSKRPRSGDATPVRILSSESETESNTPVQPRYRFVRHPSSSTTAATAPPPREPSPDFDVPIASILAARIAKVRPAPTSIPSPAPPLAARTPSTLIPVSFARETRGTKKSAAPPVAPPAASVPRPKAAAFVAASIQSAQVTPRRKASAVRRRATPAFIYDEARIRFEHTFKTRSYAAE